MKRVLRHVDVDVRLTNAALGGLSSLTEAMCFDEFVGTDGLDILMLEHLMVDCMLFCVAPQTKEMIVRRALRASRERQPVIHFVEIEGGRRKAFDAAPDGSLAPYADAAFFRTPDRHFDGTWFPELTLQYRDFGLHTMHMWDALW
jgi:hypothetical protein